MYFQIVIFMLLTINIVGVDKVSGRKILRAYGHKSNLADTHDQLLINLITCSDFFLSIDDPY